MFFPINKREMQDPLPPQRFERDRMIYQSIGRPLIETLDISSREKELPQKACVDTLQSTTVGKLMVVVQK